jgi:hypothetical protein
VATISSVNALQASVAQAERLVQQDQSRVAQDTNRLQESKDLLTKDRSDLSDTQQQSRTAQANAPAPQPINLSSAIENPPRSQQVLPADLTAPKPQVNAQGQTIGRLINITA